MDAADAAALGLVSRVVERDQLLPTAQDLAQRMLRKNPLGLRLTKEAINCNLDAPGLEQALHVEDRNQAMCFATLRYEGANPNTK
jgi:enoyl-CoA hydratase/carnithine racemase